MKILQLCCFTDQWSQGHEVESWDLRNGKDIFDMPLSYPGQFDLVCAAPPCDQFTKCNVGHWEAYPEHFIKIAERCLELCLNTGGLWFLENPPGRIEKFIPALTMYRTILWNAPRSNKEYVLYSNFLIMHTSDQRYGKAGQKKFNNMSKKQREAWDKDLIPSIEAVL